MLETQLEDSNKYYQSRHFQRLLHRYEKAVSEGQVPYMEADELTDIAEYYMTGKQDDKANQAIQAAIDMHPDSVDPQIFLARQKMFYGQLDEAHDIIDAITEQDDSEVVYLRAELLIKEGKADSASNFLLQQSTIVQENLDTYLYDCVSIFMDYDQWELAQEWLGRLKNKFPSYPDIPIMEAEIEMGLDNYEDALTMLLQIVDQNPYDSEAWNLLSETYVALENYPEAIEAADFSLAINPQDASAMLMKANAYLRSEMLEEAAQLYARYLELQPDDFNAQISLAACYVNDDRFKDALPLLEKAEQNARKLPNSETNLPQVYMQKALALSRLGRFDEAIATITKAKEMVDDSLQWKYDLAEADIYLHEKKTQQADELFSKALAKSPQKEETLFSIAISYSNAGQNEIAIDLFNDVWNIYGTEEGKFVVPYIANCYQQMNDTENYLAYLKLAPFCDREATRRLFADRFPGADPDDYYAYAFRQIYGVFPKSFHDKQD